MSAPKDATSFTEQANQDVCGHAHLDWDDRTDWEDAQRGFIARLEPPVIKAAGARRCGTSALLLSGAGGCPSSPSTPACGARRA